jgi:hypothetical protein
VIPRPIIFVLAAMSLALPPVSLVLLGAGQLLGAMQDTWGAAVLGRLAFAAALVWVLDLTALVIVLAVDRLGPPPEPPHH